MATKVKPTRLNVTGTPQAGDVPMYVDADSFQWGAGGGGSGDVTGPASSTDGHLAVFDGATGKIIKDGGSVPTSFSPDSAGTQGQVLTKGASGYDWATVSGGDVQVSTDTGNLLTTGVKLWLGDKVDFDNLGTLDSNTIYAPIQGLPRRPGENTLAYYPLDSTNTVNDTSGNNKNMTQGGTVTYGTNGGVDCAYFNGGYLYLSEALRTGANPRTVVCWYNRQNTPSEGGAFWSMGNASANKGIASYVGGSGVDAGIIAVGNWDWDKNSGVGVGQNEWHLLVVTYDGSTIKEYKDTTNIDTITGKTLNLENYRTAICQFPGLSHTAWKGYISNVIFESVARTADEVIAYYNSTKSTYGIS